MIQFLENSLEQEMTRIKHTPLIIDGFRIYNLSELFSALKSLKPDKFEPLAYNDMVSSWLDQAGYTELAEKLRPIHGKGIELKDAVIRVVKEWMSISRKE